MKYFKKNIFTCIIVFILSFQSLCYGEDLNNYVLNEYEQSAEVITAVMKFIKENYVGSEVDIKRLLNSALKGMTSVLDDYSDYYTMDEYKKYEKNFMSDFYIIGIITKQDESDYPIVTDVLDDTPAKTSGIMVGDKIISINSISLKGISLQSVTNQLISDGQHNIQIELSRNDEIITVNTNFVETKINTVYLNDISEIIGNENEAQNANIGYIKVDLISIGTADDFEAAINTLKAQNKNRLVLDLRGNVGGVVEEAFRICDLIVPEGKIVSTKDKEGNVTDVYSELKNPYFEKIVVLTDSTTASAAEMIASAVQDSGAGVVVGTKTYGKGVIQTMTPVLDMGVIKMTTLEYFTRNGNKLNKIGITPNILVDVPLFLAENDDIESDKVKKALNYLGYDTSTRIKIMNTIGDIQKDYLLTVTRTITNETANAINLKIYEEMNNNDKILAAGYEEIIAK